VFLQCRSLTAFKVYGYVTGIHIRIICIRHCIRQRLLLCFKNMLMSVVQVFTLCAVQIRWLLYTFRTSLSLEMYYVTPFVFCVPLLLSVRKCVSERCKLSIRLSVLVMYSKSPITKRCLNSTAHLNVTRYVTPRMWKQRTAVMSYTAYSVLVCCCIINFTASYFKERYYVPHIDGM